MKAIIEMPKGTKYKYEIKNGVPTIDRTLKVEVPYNYGFIPDTQAEDGDAVDVFVFSSEAIPPTTEVKIRVIGALEGIDNGVKDEKIIALLDGDLDEFLIPAYLNVFVSTIKSYLNSYKKGFLTGALLSEEQALRLIETYRTKNNVA